MTHLEAETLAAIIAVGINLPFGAYRATTARFSWQWFLAIHLPIPLVVLMRLAFGLGWWFVPFMLLAAVAGQVLGARLYAVHRSRRGLTQSEPAD